VQAMPDAVSSRFSSLDVWYLQDSLSRRERDWFSYLGQLCLEGGDKNPTLFRFISNHQRWATAPFSRG
jgi:hypothetical protein